MLLPHLPPELRGRVFNRADAIRNGLSPGVIRGPRVARVVDGIYRYVDTELTPHLLIEAARMTLPSDAVLCRTSALAWFGLDVRPLVPLHFATNVPVRSRQQTIRLHRHEGTLTPQIVRGVPTTGPDRTFVECGVHLTLAELVATGDWLITNGHTDELTLRGYASHSHLDGVQRARVAADLVRAGSESPRESMARFNLIAWGLPEPRINADVFDDHGRFLGRGDLVYDQWRLLAEYDGWYHERDATQRQKDILRREALEAAGWALVVLTSADNPSRTAWRVYNALRSRGFTGPAPRFQAARFGRWMQPNGPSNYKN